jgi:GWxTD domain-containing protein
MAFAASGEGVSDPAAALAGAKAQIAARKYSAAADLLAPAIKFSETMRDDAQQQQALTALYFYAAVAESGMKRPEEAMAHLRQALKLSPNLRNIDATKYEAEFVTLFQHARAELGTNTNRFEELYPGYSESSPLKQTAAAELWQNPALEILGSRKEKHDWEGAVSPQDREKFMSAFWQEREQATPAGSPRVRDVFTRRIGFADTAFASPGERGAMSDRGRVFAVLGAPAIVRRRALDSGDTANMTAFNRNSIGIEVGTVEYWTYSREQLPVAHPAPTVTFRFVTHQGIGDYVLQKDGVPLNLLAAATRPRRD